MPNEQTEIAVIVITGLPDNCYPRGIRIATYPASMSDYDICMDTVEHMSLPPSGHVEVLESRLEDEHGFGIQVVIERGHFI